MNNSISYIILLLILVLPACSVTKGPLYAEGEIAGQIIGANLDSNIAKHTLAPSIDEPAELGLHREFLERSIDTIPNPDQLKYLVEQGSPDFASIVYARALLNEPNNYHWHTQSQQLGDRINDRNIKNRLKQAFERHHALLIPGWHWKTRSDTGADLSFQRRILASFGLQSTLIETNEHGSVEENGTLIAQAIKDANNLNKSVVLISVSKGGADTAYALGSVLDATETPYLKGWLNIGGIIAGSTLVDISMDDPKRWLRSIGFSEDTPTSAFLDLNTTASSERLGALDFPSEVTVVNYVAMPFASSVNDKSKHSYTMLSDYGPNDGAALIHEMLVPEAHTVLEIGLDHYMRSRRAMNRALSLLMMIMECDQESGCE